MPKSVKEVQEELKNKSVEQPAELSKSGEVKESPQVDLAEVRPAEIKDGNLILTNEQRNLIRTQIAPSATEDEFKMFLMMAYRTRLDPLMKQLYFIKYSDKVSYVTSIDGYRIIAARTGEFAGSDEPRFEYDRSGKLSHCAVTVYRFVKGQKVGFSAKVSFREYTTNKNQWVTKPETMLAKVAESHALRKAFPNDLSGIYTQDEMEQAEPKKPPVEKMTWEQNERIRDLIGLKGMLESELITQIETAAEVRPGSIGSISRFTKKMADTVIRHLEKMPDTVIRHLEKMPDYQSTQEDVQEIDLEAVDQGITQMRNDARPGAQATETIH